MDDITLQFLTSKKRYNQIRQFVEPEDPVARDAAKYVKRVHQYESRMKEILGFYFADPQAQVTLKLDGAVEQCFRALIEHILKDIEEEKALRNNYDATSETEDEDEDEDKEEGEEN
jgi:hypothetical protein